MAENRAERVVQDLVAKGIVDQKNRRDAQRILEEVLPKKVYKYAVLFLGVATLILAMGGVGLAGLQVKVIPDALWTALGAGIGGLAGIFTGED
jgi:hypothetical protein